MVMGGTQSDPFSEVVCFWVARFAGREPRCGLSGELPRPETIRPGESDGHSDGARGWTMRASQTEGGGRANFPSKLIGSRGGPATHGFKCPAMGWR